MIFLPLHLLGLYSLTSSLLFVSLFTTALLFGILFSVYVTTNCPSTSVGSTLRTCSVDVVTSGTEMGVL